MKIATFNVNGIKTRLPHLLRWLEREQPDVACLQELKALDEGFPVAELRDAGYGSVHHSAGRWAGVAVLARSDAEVAAVCTGLAGEPAADEARWIEAEVEGTRVVSVYVPNGQAIGAPAFADKLRFLEAIRERVGELATEGPLLVAGDFNVCREDVDVYDPAAFAGSTHVTEEERSRFEAILDAGLVDSFRRLHPDAVAYTWWDYRAGNFHKGLGLRIDYILATPDLADGVERCGIARDYRKGKKPSDHAPLMAQIGAAADGVEIPDASDSKQI
jgi:exodeoxyribonuclease III